METWPFAGGQIVNREIVDADGDECNQQRAEDKNIEHAKTFVIGGNAESDRPDECCDNKKVKPGGCCQKYMRKKQVMGNAFKGVDLVGFYFNA